MALDLNNLQTLALSFLQEQLQNSDISNKDKIQIALDILKLQPATSAPKPEVQSTDTAAEVSQNLPIPALYRLSESWQMWLVENKLRGVSDQSLVEILQGQGLTEIEANHVVFALPQEVSFAFLESRWRSHQQQQFAAEVYREKEKLANGSIDIWQQLSGKEFQQYYWRTHRPVILHNLGGDRPWHTPESFTTKFGEHPVSTSIFPKPAPTSSTAQEHQLAIQTLRDYFSISEPQVYVEMGLLELGTEAIASFYAAYPVLKQYLDDQAIEGTTHLWLQSTFAPFPLQAKPEDTWVVQLWGKSQWQIAAPWHSEFLYGDENWVSAINFDNHNPDRYPLLENAKFYSFTLEAGQALYLPALWWQQCRAMENSAQVFCQNLRSAP